jgi:hypothetical protein
MAVRSGRFVFQQPSIRSFIDKAPNRAAIPPAQYLFFPKQACPYGPQSDMRYNHALMMFFKLRLTNPPRW